MPEQRRNPVTGWWERVPDPREASIWQTGTYAAIMVGGIVGLVDPPTAIAVQVSAWMMTYWAALLAFGGALGAVAVLPGQYWLERIGIVACSFGFAIYIVALAFAVSTGEFRHAGTAITIDAFVIGLLCNMRVRWVRVRHSARDPERFSTYGKHRHRAAP